ncbi:hypothetical protein LNV09_16715 [Paucibacter sp. B2R-40]|uniref:hypothetical protein n=1 Tax=Paucibacter sp. B2R-40 TaxID=2893554 RepID=UPI0021E43A0F|nr:hypothetical protein [Paucibacter sp. B2R-40]MCV2355787.1 hypothetical protein [Paucibacter sp. B2R-40]
MLPRPRRSGAYRMYKQEHGDAVMLIRQAQSLGFRLMDLRSQARLELGVFFGIKPMRICELGPVLQSSQAQRAKWLEQAAKLAAAA